MKPIKYFNVIPDLPEELKHLEELAYNLWIFWNYEAVILFHRIDSQLWEEVNHNPVLLLGKVSQERLNELAEDEGFLSQLERIYEDYKIYIESKKTYSFGIDASQKYRVAYLSMEYGLTEALPIYSGGLGILSGDHLKSSSDLSIPLVGVGLCYKEGYFQQYLNSDGWQQEEYIRNDFNNMPLKAVYDKDGEPVYITIKILGEDIYARIWYVSVGRIKLYLLDTNDMRNSQQNRLLTSKLYGGDVEMRIKQEMLLGIGGLRTLARLGIKHEVTHMNEGHTAFSVFENIRVHMEKRTFF